MINKIQAREQMGLHPELKTVLITGGSQGSAPINAHILQNLDAYVSQDIQLIWQCGMRDYDMLRSAVTDETVQLHKFITDMGRAYSAADVVISRAGAIALAEIMICAKPAILIPFPYAAGDHQTVNARTMVQRKAARMVRQSGLQSGELEQVLFNLLANSTKLEELSYHAGQMARPAAAEQIAAEVVSLVA